MRTTRRVTALLAGTALVAAGFGAGAVVALTGSASAATDTASTATGTTGEQQPDPSRSVRPDEHLLTGATASKVRVAALAKYPNATIERVETDSDGVYEAHILTSAGQHLIVQVGTDFAVTGTDTGTDTGPGAGGPRGDHDGDGPQGPPPSGSSG